MPIFAGLFGMLLGRERLTSRFWFAAAVSAAGVALVAVGSGHEVSGGLVGILLGLAVPATWAAYSVAVATLMASYSAIRVSAVVVPLSWILIALGGIPQTTIRTGTSAGRSGPCSHSPPSARSCSRTCSGSGRSAGSALRERHSP